VHTFHRSFPKHHSHFHTLELCVISTILQALNDGFSIVSSPFQPLTYNLTLLFQASPAVSLPASRRWSEVLRLLL
ncbi:Uncharacterized protein DAT39_013646, partial [Clarias magur]